MSETSAAPHFTDRQRAEMKARTIQDAEFLMKGGEYTEVGRLALSEASIADAYAEEFKKTAEHQRIQEHVGLMQGLSQDIGFMHLGHAGIPRPPEKTAEDVTLGLWQLRKQQINVPLRVNSEESAEQAIEVLANARRTLQTVTAPLATRGDLHFGSQVNVLRNKDIEHPTAYVQGGWTIDDITVAGMFALHLDQPEGDPLTKEVPISTIIALNPDPLAEPNKQNTLPPVPIL